MIYDVPMPKLGWTMEEGVIEAWLKAEGDHVEKGETLLRILTEKVSTEVESEVTGTVVKILAAPEATVKVGETIAQIETGD